MLKSQYTLIQVLLCSPSGSFLIYQGLPEVSQGQTINEYNFGSEINAGEFKQQNSACLTNCCSCRKINELNLNMYGQLVSSAHITKCCSLCCFNPFCCLSDEMIVTTVNSVLIGKVIKEICFKSYILAIYDAENSLKYKVQKRQCQWQSWMPRTLRFGNSILYDILDKDNKVQGQVINRGKSCCESIWTMLDEFEIKLPSDANDKERILLLNAVVYLDLVKHEFF